MVDNSDTNNINQDKDLINSFFGFLDVDNIRLGKQWRENSLVFPSSQNGETNFDFKMTGLLSSGGEGSENLEDFRNLQLNDNYQSESTYRDDFGFAASNMSGTTTKSANAGNIFPSQNSPNGSLISSKSIASSGPSNNEQFYPNNNSYYKSSGEIYQQQQLQRFDMVKQQQQQSFKQQLGSGGVSPSGMNPLAPAFTLPSPPPPMQSSPQEYYDNNRNNNFHKYAAQQQIKRPLQSNKSLSMSPNHDSIPHLHSPVMSSVELPLKVLSIDVNGSFNSMETAQERAMVFEFIDYCGAQVILMNNTGLVDENQLKIVRNEIKMKFNTESAMWASFGSSEVGGGRGVGVLVLGPLAPRTGWIRSDESGRFLSASSRIKPGLPVVSFVACDFPGNNLKDSNATATNPWNKTLNDMTELLGSEVAKGNLIFVGGNISGTFSSPEEENKAVPAHETVEHVCHTILSSGVYLNCLQNIPDAPSVAVDPNVVRALPDDVLISGISPYEAKRVPPVIRPVRAHRFVNQLQRGRDPCITGLTIQGWPIEAYAFNIPVNRSSQHAPHTLNRKPTTVKKMNPKEYIGSAYGAGNPSASNFHQGNSGGGMHHPMGMHQTQGLSRSPQFSSYGDQKKILSPQSSINKIMSNSNNMNSNKFLPTDPVREIVNKSRNAIDDLNAWKNKTAEGITILSMINSQGQGQSQEDQMVKYEQIKLLLRSLFNCLETFNHRFNQPGFADTASFLELHKLDVSPPEDFMLNAESVIHHLLTQWNIISDHMIKQLSYSQY